MLSLIDQMINIREQWRENIQQSDRVKNTSPSGDARHGK